MIQVKRQCGLCGATKKLIKTECCKQWICDDEDEYVLFSFARNSCRRNHRRYTLCSHHFENDHKGDWKTCSKCKHDFDTEDYVNYATNECNFEKLKNPPKFKPTHCTVCSDIIIRSEGGYSTKGDKYYCMKCQNIDYPGLK